MRPITEKDNLLATLEGAFTARGFEQNPLQRKAMDFVLEKGLPTLKSEEYRFAPITRTLENIFRSESTSDSPSISPSSLLSIPDMPSHLVVFVNGIFSPAHSRMLDDTVSLTLTHLQNVKADQDTFELLNHAFAENAVHIQVAENVSVKHPIAIVYYFDSPNFVFANPQWVCSLGAHSNASLLEYTVARTPGAFFNNKHSRVEVGENADLEFAMIQNGSEEEILLNNSHIEIAFSSRVTCHTITLKGKIIRNNLSLALNGERIDARLNGLYLVSGSNLVDNHTVVDHRKPNSYSNELYKGVIDGQGKAVFNGKIFVRPDAQKTNAYQTNRNILLSETGTIHTKPQLEIWADDVKCSHGCTTGQLDEEALFYLQSRGISKDLAKGMLLNAFAGETLNGMKNEKLRSLIDALVTEKLHPADQP